MIALSALCMLAGILPGLVVDALAPVVAELPVGPAAASGHHALAVADPDRARAQFLQRHADARLHRHVRAFFRRSPSTVWRLARRAPRAGLGLWLPGPGPDTQYTASSFAQPIRRVFGTTVFRARERVEMPPPGSLQPARLTVHLRDLIWEFGYLPIAASRWLRRRVAQPVAVLYHPAIPEHRSRAAGGAPHRHRPPAIVAALTVQLGQMLLVLITAPLLVGWVRSVKARLLRRRGPSPLQPYRDLLRLIRKEVVLAENASWLFRAVPYIVFAALWVAASLVPTFATGLLFSWSADVIVIVALLGTARFFLALAGMDIGTSFGGLGASREMMIASVAEPAMIMVVFTLSLLAGSTQLSSVAEFMQNANVGLRVSLALVLIALLIVALPRTAAFPWTTRRRTSSSPWFTRRWSWNTPAAIWR